MNKEDLLELQNDLSRQLRPIMATVVVQSFIIWNGELPLIFLQYCVRQTIISYMMELGFTETQAGAIYDIKHKTGSGWENYFGTVLRRLPCDLRENKYGIFHSGEDTISCCANENGNWIHNPIRNLSLSGKLSTEKKQEILLDFTDTRKKTKDENNIINDAMIEFLESDNHDIQFPDVNSIICKDIIDRINQLLSPADWNNLLPPSGIEENTRSHTIRNEVVEMYDFRCQVCGKRYPTYAAALAHGAHIRDHSAKGAMALYNLLCLCPNHHGLYDRYAFTITPSLYLESDIYPELNGRKLLVLPEHKIDTKCLQFKHNTYLLRTGKIL